MYNNCLVIRFSKIWSEKKKHLLIKEIIDSVVYHDGGLELELIHRPNFARYILDQGFV